MKNKYLALTVSSLLFAGAAYAQTLPQAPASWVAFQQQENAKRKAFYEQMKSDRDAFLNANPDVKAYLDQMREASKARRDAWRAQHPRNNLTH